MTTEVANATAALSGDTSAISAVRILRLLLEFMTSDIQVPAAAAVADCGPILCSVPYHGSGSRSAGTAKCLCAVKLEGACLAAGLQAHPDPPCVSRVLFSCVVMQRAR